MSCDLFSIETCTNQDADVPELNLLGNYSRLEILTSSSDGQVSISRR